jgi:hypothetical protein
VRIECEIEENRKNEKTPKRKYGIPNNTRCERAHLHSTTQGSKDGLAQWPLGLKQQQFGAASARYDEEA